MFTLPESYKTGNKKLDGLIAKQLLRDKKVKPSKIQVLNALHTVEKRRSKYNVDTSPDGIQKRTYHDGTLFASIRELERWDYLLKIQQAGEIEDLRRQVDFILQDFFYTSQYGKISEIIYVADFVYTNITFRPGYKGMKVIEDSKGEILTPVYKIKKKLLLMRYPTYLFFEV